jgi:hypothetical protein
VNRLDVQAPAPGAKPVPRPEVFKNIVATGNLKETAPKVNQNLIAITSEKGTVANIDYVDLSADVEMSALRRPSSTATAPRALGGSVSGSGIMEPEDIQVRHQRESREREPHRVFHVQGAGHEGRAGRTVQRRSAHWRVRARSGKTSRRRLPATGGALVLEGSLLNMNIANQIFTGIQSVPMVPPNLTERMKARNPRLFAIRTRRCIENLSSKFQIANGKDHHTRSEARHVDFALGRRTAGSRSPRR